MLDRDSLELAKAYTTILEKQMPKKASCECDETPCPCKDGKGKCSKKGCKCKKCLEVMSSKKK